MKKSNKLNVNPILLIAGDVHGHWDILAQHAEAALSAYGRIDGIICVGDVQAFRNEEDMRGMHCPAKYLNIGKFPRVMSKKITFPAPIWFIGGNHEPWPALDAHGAGEWIPGVTYLGRAGVAEILGLRVAFLSGIYSPVVSEKKATQRQSIKDRTYWVRSELEKVMAANKKGSIDLLITHDWPAGIGTNKNKQPCGSEDITALDRRLRPSLHVCGHMHHRLSATLNDTKVEAVGHIRSGGDGSCMVQWYEGEPLLLEPLPLTPLPRI